MKKLIVQSMFVGLMLVFFASLARSQSLELVGKGRLSYGIGSVIGVMGNYVYLGERGLALAIWDVSDPTNPVMISHLEHDQYIEDLIVRGNKVYLSYCSGVIKIVDVSDPANPQFMGSIDLGQHNHHVAMSKGMLFQAHCNSAMIINIINPWLPTVIAKFDSLESYLLAGIAVSGNYAITTHANAGRLNIWDISNPLMPDSVGAYFNSDAYYWNIVVSGGYAYVMDDWHGTRIFDVTNPAIPLLADSSIDFTWGGFAISGNYLFLAGAYLRAYDISNPPHPIFLEQYLCPDYDFHDVCVSGDLLYAVSNDSLYILRFNPTDIINYDNYPSSFSLSQNYPNPFNAQSSIRYSLPKAGVIEMAIYNIMGQKVAVLSNGVQRAGEHTAVWHAKDVPSGVYFARLQTGETNKTIKMVLLK